MSLRLIVETPSDNNDFEYITEERNANEPRTLYIKGPYMGADMINRNKRLYPIDEMVREIERYDTDMIKTGRAMGELNHPTTADVDLSRACHLVVEIKREGNIFVGKSKVLTTPTGMIVRSLINDGVKIGMSSRALGQLIPESNGSNRVKDFRLVAVDCVADPSFGKAYVNGILESKQYILNSNGSYEEIYDRFEKKLSTLPKSNRDAYLREAIVSFINKL